MRFPHLPEDFEAFWAETVGEAMAEPLEFDRSLRDEALTPDHVVETYRMRGMHGAEIHGWFAYPHGARRAPAFLWVPPYGRESVLPNAYGTRPGYASISLNFHGHGAFHQERYVPARGYFAEGADDPYQWIFRTMVQNLVILLRGLRAQIEVDEDRIGVMGMSQGGGLAIALGAHSTMVRAVCADMPFLGAMRTQLSKAVYRYPLKELTDFADTMPLGLERVLNTIDYYDTLHQSGFCRVPTLVSLGEKDPAVKPETALAIYEALPGEKRLVRYDWGHDWHPDMVSNNAAWLDAHLRPA